MGLLRWCVRRWYVPAGALLLALAIAALLFPYILKRVIEEHSEEWIGRRVRIGSIVLNPFTGTYAVEGFTCYEPGSDSVFVSFSRLGVKADVLRGWRTGTWRLREAELRDPYVHVVQQGARFNFSDLLELGGEEAPAPAGDRTGNAFDAVGIALTGGRIVYRSDALRSPLRIRDLDVRCSRISSGQAAMDFALALALEEGGRLQGGFTIDTGSGGYAIDARLAGFALGQLRPYVQEFMDCGELDGSLDLDLRLRDSFADTAALAISGRLGLLDLRLADPGGEPLLRIGRLAASLDTLVAAEQRFELGRVELQGAEARFALLEDGTDNWTRLLKLPADTSGALSTEAVSASNALILLAEYITYLGREFVASAYSARSLRVSDCAVHFADHTAAMPFRYEVEGIALSADRVATDRDSAWIAFGARIGGSGQASGKAAFDPKDLRNVRLALELEGLRLARLDPYGRWYAAHPIEDGVLDFRSATAIDHGRIDSRNALRIDRLRFGKRVEEHDTGIVVLPLRLAAGLLKDVDGRIALDLPVTGDLNDPQFRVWPIVWQVLKNLVMKAVTAPGRALARAVGGADEDALDELRMEHLQAAVGAPQQKTLRLLARVLAGKPELRVDLLPLADAQAEAEELALLMAKQQHLFGGAALAHEDSARAQALPSSDSLFVAWVKERSAAMEGRSIRARCMAVAGEAAVRERQQGLERQRQEAVAAALSALGAEEGRFAFRPGDAEEASGRMGRPGYRLVFDAAE